MNFLTHMGEPRIINLFLLSQTWFGLWARAFGHKGAAGRCESIPVIPRHTRLSKIPRDRQSRVLDFPQRCLVRPFARILLFIFLSFPAHADEAAWRALEIPGTFALMRHALAPGTGDPTEVRIGDCTTQRNLNAAGRDQAQRIGHAFRERGIAFDAVYTSQWCRCRETAKLLDLGTPVDLLSLNSFFDNWQESETRTASSRKFLSEKAPGKRLMLVTHQVNISALTGEFTQSGEVLVVRQSSDGKLRTLGSIHLAPE